jgi:hypothetical protein
MLAFFPRLPHALPPAPAGKRSNASDIDDSTFWGDCAGMLIRITRRNPVQGALMARRACTAPLQVASTVTRAFRNSLRTVKARMIFRRTRIRAHYLAGKIRITGI